jgi:putative CocE/NonD family hydrolase
MNQRISIGIATAVMAVMLASAFAQTPAQVSKPGRYSGYSTATYDGVERTSFYIPMRDGVKLAADLYRPTRNGMVASEKLPVIWSHTPYNRRGRATPMEALIKHGYNVAVVDFRGVYASYGSNKGYNRGEWIDPAKNDAYDATEWFAKQAWSNGNIGMWGCSAVGGSQMQAATTRPPSLKAVIPQSAEFEPYPVWVLGGMAAKANVGTPTAEGGTNQVAQRDSSAVAVDGPDGAGELAKAITSHAGNFDSPGQLPFRDSVSSTVGVPWWLVTNPSAHLQALKRPGMGVMVTANWDEAGTRHGAFTTMGNLTPGYVKMIVGPGAHCGWNVALREAGMDIDIEQLRFFDYWLKGVKNGVMEEDPVTYFTYNAAQGKAWQTAKAWPPKSRPTDYFLTAKALSADKPSKSGTLVAPMVAPVRISSISVTTGAGSVSYETAPLQSETEVTGDPVVSLWISTAAADTDVIAQLEDVAPDGTAKSYQMLGGLRASVRKLGTAPYDNRGLPWHPSRKADVAPLKAGESVELKFALLPMSYVFKAGNRIRLTLSFSDPASGAAQTVTVHEGGKNASQIGLPIVAK